jgi:hypothetical protein
MVVELAGGVHTVMCIQGLAECKCRFINWRRICSGLVRFVFIPALVSSFCFMASCGAATKRYSRDGYEWVPVKSAISNPTGRQKEMLSLAGEPDAVWKTPFGTVMWVYCRKGHPSSIVVFGEREVILQGASPGRADLCE